MDLAWGIAAAPAALGPAPSTAAAAAEADRAPHAPPRVLGADFAFRAVASACAAARGSCSGTGSGSDGQAQDDTPVFLARSPGVAGSTAGPSPAGAPHVQPRSQGPALAPGSSPYAPWGPAACAGPPPAEARGGAVTGAKRAGPPGAEPPGKRPPGGAAALTCRRSDVVALLQAHAPLTAPDMAHRLSGLPAAREAPGEPAQALREVLQGLVGDVEVLRMGPGAACARVDECDTATLYVLF